MEGALPERMTTPGPRILYFMHVDWRWIKQRPHFLAESLTGSSNVLVMFRPTAPKSHRTSNPSSVRRLPLLPVPRRFGQFFERLDSLIQCVWVSLVAMCFRPNVVWVPFPTTFAYVPRHLRRLPVVYDCMDDAAGFQADRRKAEVILQAERELVNASALIVCSSNNLAECLRKRYGPSHKILVVRNGLTEELTMATGDVQKRQSRPTLDIAYVGTIADWFDCDTLLHCLDRMPDLFLHLIGPVDRALPAHERLVVHGPVPHHELSGYVARFDAFIMPFVRTPLVESVDPVKLYEYLAFGREVITVYYPEIERFESLVHFYRSPQELLALLQSLRDGSLVAKNVPERTRPFLAENTWGRRARLVEAEIHRLLGASP